MNFSGLALKSRRDFIAALLVLTAFALAGWKIGSRSSMPDFLPAAQLSVSKPITGQGAAEAAIAAQVPVQRSPDGLFNFNARFVSSQPGQAVHAASMVELQGGRLRAVWFSGSREGAGDVTIQTSVMNPETLNWSEETTLFNRRQLQQDLWRYVKKLGNPVIARMPDESLMLWMVNVSIGGWAGSSITWARSTDEGTSWSTPRRLVTSPFLNISTLVKGAPLFYANGHFGLPVYHEFVTKFSEVLRINAQGQVVDKTRIPGSQTSLQPVILVTGSSNAQMYMRSSSSTAVMMSTTGDAGQTWSFTQPTRNANPDSALAGVVTGTGQQWLALNPSRKNREVLALLRASASGSFDGVRPWIVEATPAPEKLLSVIDYERLLSRELRTHGASEMQIQAYVGSAKRQLCGTKTCVQEFSYPYLLQSQDGYLHLIYTWHRSRIKHIRLDPFQVLSFNGAESPGVHVASFAY